MPGRSPQTTDPLNKLTEIIVAEPIIQDAPMPGEATSGRGTPKLLAMSMNKAILFVAIPAMFTHLFQILFELVDTFWLDRLKHPDVFASMGAASFITWSLYALMLTVNAGVNSLTGRAAGAQDENEWNLVAWQGLVLALCLGLGITAAMGAVHPAIFRAVGLKGSVLSGATAYFSIMNMGYCVFFLYSFAATIFNSHGDTRTTMIVGTLSLTMNAVLDPVLILGLGGLPAMGIRGAATATVLSQAAGLAALAFMLVRKGFVRTTPPEGVMNMPHARQILTIGLPQAATHWVFSMVYPVLSRFLTTLGNVAALGALSICHRIEGVPYFMAVSFSISAATLGSQLIGAGRREEAVSAINRTVLIASLPMAAMSLVFVLAPEQLLSMIIDAGEVISEGAVYLRIIGYLELFLCWEVVFEGAFTGLGMTRYPMYISIPLTVARIPLAWLLAFRFGLGVRGIWWAISLTTFLKGAGIGALFWAGGWRRDFSGRFTGNPKIERTFAS